MNKFSKLTLQLLCFLMLLQAFSFTVLAETSIASNQFGSILVNALKQQTSQNSNINIDTLYNLAVNDSKTIEPEEILPVTAITQSNNLSTWNETKDKVLLLTWHKYPDSYPTGKNVTIDWGEVWTFTDKEMKQWYDKNKTGVTDWQLRLQQLIGLPTDKQYTHFSAIWVKPSDIVRPAYVYDITKSEMADAFTKPVDTEFEKWFEGNVKWSYEESAYPWTRLGYTYDWADNGTEFGLSEFLVKKGAEVEVAFTYTTAEFLDWLNK